MSAFQPLLRREFAQLLRSPLGLGPLLLSLAGSGAFFAWLVRSAEGTPETLHGLWTFASAFGVLFLAASTASRGFAQDRERGMLRLMFATPVKARWWVLGKVFASWLFCLVYLGGMGLSCWALVRWLLPEGAQAPMAWSGFLLGAGMLAVEAFLWSSLGTLASLLSRNTASTFLVALLASVAAPPAFAFVLQADAPWNSLRWPWFPLQAIAYNGACGLVDLRALAGCLTASAVLVYAAALILDALRLCATER